MPAPPITALPTAPQRTDSSSVFSDRADAFVAALATFRTEINALASYLDALANGAFKTYVRAATTANGTLATAFANGQTIDGVTLATGDRILLKNQTTGSENGIYTVNASGAPTRATDADIGGEMVSALITVSEGTTLADTLWICTTNAPITLGSTALTFSQFTGGGMLGSNNLSELTNPGTARTNIGTAYATSGEINTGTEAGKVVSPDALAGSNFGKAVVTVLVSDPNGSAITTGDGKAYYRVPSTLNGMNLVGVAAALTTVSSSGIPTVQIANVTQAADMLTTKLTIDASETDSSTAATAAVIDTANDDVATGDMLRIDIDVAGTGAKGLMVEMQFQLP